MVALKLAYRITNFGIPQCLANVGGHHTCIRAKEDNGLDDRLGKGAGRPRVCVLLFKYLQHMQPLTPRLAEVFHNLHPFNVHGRE